VLALALLVATPALALDVTVDASVETPAQPVVRGTTNLPDGTVLVVTVSQTAGDFAATRTTTVEGGGFTAGPFTFDGRDLDPGTYKVEVVMEMSVQSPTVRQIVGSHGMRMAGPLVKQGSTGQLIDYTKEFIAAAASGTATASPPGQTAPAPWVLASCADQVDFLNRSIRAKAVGGHELVGEQRDKWVADCVRQTAGIPHTDTVIH
jgi:hypothetical protein